MASTVPLAQSVTRFRLNRIGSARRKFFGRRRLARPRLERLEERTLLSAWLVTDDSDSPTDTGSLRYAIQTAPSGTTIEFHTRIGWVRA